MKYEVWWSRPGEEEVLRCVDELEVLARRLRAAVRNYGSITVYKVVVLRPPELLPLR